MKPAETLSKMNNWLSEMQKAKKLVVAVGLVRDKLRQPAYEDGTDVRDVGLAHEFGVGVPQRSWLRATNEIKRNDIKNFISKEFEAVSSGKTTTVTALDRVGAFANFQIKLAFDSNGFGQWKPLSDSTIAHKEAHGRTKTLVFTGLLRNNIGWAVRNVA